MRGFLLGLGLIAAVMLLLYPWTKGQKPQPRRFVQESDAQRFERQASTAQDVTATAEDEREERRARQRDLTDEEISARRESYRPPDAWRWKYEPFAPENIDCDWIPEWNREVCHTRFEEPIGYDRPPPRPRQQRIVKPRFVRYGPPVRVRVPCNGGCPYP